MQQREANFFYKVIFLDKMSLQEHPASWQKKILIQILKTKQAR